MCASARNYRQVWLEAKGEGNRILHHASKMIVQQAKNHDFGIVMERLTGLRKLYRRGNGQGRWYRGRMNSWSYAELQRQIEYKARWEGLPVHICRHVGRQRSVRYVGLVWREYPKRTDC